MISPIATVIPRTFAILDGIGGFEVILVAAVALMLFGGEKMPEMARGLGKLIKEFKKATSEVEHEIKKAMEEPPTPPPRPPAPGAVAQGAFAAKPADPGLLPAGAPAGEVDPFGYHDEPHSGEPPVPAPPPAAAPIVPQSTAPAPQPGPAHAAPHAGTDAPHPPSRSEDPGIDA